VLHATSQEPGVPSCYDRVRGCWLAVGEANAAESIGARRARERRGEELPPTPAPRARARRTAELEVLTQTAGRSRLTVNDVVDASGGTMAVGLVDVQALARAAVQSPGGVRALAPEAYDAVASTRRRRRLWPASPPRRSRTRRACGRPAAWGRRAAPRACLCLNEAVCWGVGVETQGAGCPGRLASNC